jgi:UPF0755 protein
MQVYWSIVRYVGFILIVAVLLSVFLIVLSNDMLSFVMPEENFTIVITEDNDTAGAIAEELQNNGIINHPLFFRIYAKITGNEKLNPGTYELSSTLGYEALLYKMSLKNAPRATVDVTVPEGYTVAEIFALLEEKGVCTAADLERSALEDEFNYSFLPAASAAASGETDAEETPQVRTDVRWLEGYLFPDTYTFYVDDTPKRVLKKFLSNFSGKFSAILRKRLEELNMSMADVINVASMVEKEAKLDQDRKVIASVIYNRLESDSFACLQIDATVQYALGEHKESLTAEDLKINSPYNTYVVEGLPAGPICNPGLQSIYAALYPAAGGYYYYVARPDGSHYFAKTSADHSKNVAKAAQEFKDEAAKAAAKATAAPAA